MYSAIIPAYKISEKLYRTIDVLEGCDFVNKICVVTPCALEMGVGGKGSVKGVGVSRSGSESKKSESRNKRKRAHEKVVVIHEEKRGGKARAINLALERIFKENDPTEYVILSASDLVYNKETIEKMVAKFRDGSVGLVTSRPVPLKIRSMWEKGFTAIHSELMWTLHHHISKKAPKAGELIIFRNVVKRVEETADDEEYIASVIIRKGYRRVYASDALVYNVPPKSVKRLFDQRVRVFIGHLDLKRNEHYNVPTLYLLYNVEALLGAIRNIGIKSEFKGGLGFKFGCILSFIIFEWVARIYAFFAYYLLRRNPYIWESTS